MISFFKINLKFAIFLALAISFLLFSCEKKEDEYAVDPNKISVISVQANGTDLSEGDEGIKIDVAFSIIFSKPVNEAMVREGLSLSGSNGAANITITFNDNSSIMAITPNDSLTYETLYTLTIAGGSIGVGGESMVNNFERTFTTEREPLPLFDSGMGTLEDPYTISTAEQMDLVRDFLNSHFKLIADIDLTELSSLDALGWVPIGVLGDGFVGIFDGCGFTISGLNIQRPEQNEIGLFGVLDGDGVLKNVNLQVTGIHGGQAVGALVGRQMTGLIENCHSAGSITAISSRIGGLVGSQETGLITKCSSSCGVSSEISRVGGLVGLSDMGTVTESFASGNCTSLSARVGGLIGSVETAATVRNCYAIGNISAKNRGGGLFGRLDGSAIGCYAIGNVTVTDVDESGDYAGHAIGQLDAAATANDIYYPHNQVINYNGNADITVDGTSVNIADLSCSTPNVLLPNLDFVEVWKCDLDGNWPLLAWQ